MQHQISSKELNLRIAIKAIAIAVSIYGMCVNFGNLMFFTYFTNLSNIFIDIMLGIFLVEEIKGRGKNTPLHKNNGYLLKFLATLAISITFLVFLLILAPSDKGGFIQAYVRNGCGSLGVHFVGPLLAIVDFCLFDYEYVSNGRHVVYAVIPPLCYVGFVVILNSLGVHWGRMSAPYNFLNFGAPTGWFGFDLKQMSGESLGIGVFYMVAVLLLIFLGIGKLFLVVKDIRRKRVYAAK